MTAGTVQDTEAWRCRVTGRVQGVFFRASTQKVAKSLGLVGYAHNCPDRSVEVLAIGSPAALADLRAWLSQGPPAAKVENLECVATVFPDPLPTQFTTG